MPRDLQFFLSFEDGFVAVLNSYGIAPGSRLLFPEFYCMEVIEGLKRRGYQCACYACLASMRPNEESLLSAVSEYQPRLVCIYHPLGLSVQVQCQMPEGVVLLEDHAHSLLDASELRIRGPGHVVMDSIRKVSPLQGSRVASAKTLSGAAWSLYRYRLLILHLGYRLLLFAARLSGGITTWRATDCIFERYTCLVGSARQPARGFFWDRWLVSRLSAAKARAARAPLAARAHALAASLARTSKIFCCLEFAESDFMRLRSYPLGLARPDLDGMLLRFLSQRGLRLDYIFPDCPFCRNLRLLMVPLGLGSSVADLERIFGALVEFEERLP